MFHILLYDLFDKFATSHSSAIWTEACVRACVRTMLQLVYDDAVSTEALSYRLSIEFLS